MQWRYNSITTLKLLTNLIQSLVSVMKRWVGKYLIPEVFAKSSIRKVCKHIIRPCLIHSVPKLEHFKLPMVSTIEVSFSSPINQAKNAWFTSTWYVLSIKCVKVEFHCFIWLRVPFLDEGRDTPSFLKLLDPHLTPYAPWHLHMDKNKFWI